MTLQMLRQRDVYSAHLRLAARARAVRRERKGAPAETRNTTCRTSWFPCRSRQARAGRRARGTRRGLLQGAKCGEDFAQLAVTYSEAARTSKAVRSAGARPRSCPSFAETHPEDEARACYRADPHAERPPSLQAQRGARRRAGRARRPGPCAAHPAEDQRDRGRPDGAAEARSDPRAHPRRREISRRSPR